jgi:hypothetical protein
MLSSFDAGDVVVRVLLSRTGPARLVGGAIGAQL